MQVDRFRALPRLVCAALTFFPFLRSASAFDYDEHQDIACAAVQSTCDELVGEIADLEARVFQKEPGADARLSRAKIVGSFLCATRCGKAHVNVLAFQSYGYNSLVSSRNCRSVDFGDLVALVDHFSLAELKVVTCKEVEVVAGEFVHYALEAMRNDDHFCPLNAEGYSVHHSHAVTVATDAAVKIADIPETARSFRLALVEEAYALHLLTDNFAAGHLYARLEDDTDILVTKNIHDYYNEHGARVVAGDGSLWRSYGDGHLWQCDTPSECADNRGRAVKATTDSLRVVVNAFVDGRLEGGQDDVATFEAPRCPLVIVNRTDGAIERIPEYLKYPRGEWRVGLGALSDGVGFLRLGYAKPLASWISVNVVGESDVSDWTLSLPFARHDLLLGSAGIVFNLGPLVLPHRLWHWTLGADLARFAIDSTGSDSRWQGFRTDFGAEFLGLYDLVRVSVVGTFNPDDYVARVGIEMSYANRW